MPSPSIVRTVRSPDADIIEQHLATKGVTRCFPVHYTAAYRLHRVRGTFLPADLDPCKLVLELPSGET